VTYATVVSASNVADPLSRNPAFLMAISTRRVRRGEGASAVATAVAPRECVGQPALSLDAPAEVIEALE
jgi:hypothetical protein